MESAKTSLNLIFFDCCRSVPNLMTKERHGNQGLAPYRSESENTLVSYATKHGMIAYDNSEGTNSLYTSTLAKEILQPGLVIEEVLRRVAKTVFYKSANARGAMATSSSRFTSPGKLAPLPPSTSTRSPRIRLPSP